jgi:MFS transporter, NNP family, nitrate/nitrite transporter
MSASAATDVRPGQWRALVVATVAFAANFWAWGLLSPLAPDYREVLELSALQTSILVAVPVLLGSVARIPIGALTDRYGGRVMFTALSLFVILPLLLLAAIENYPVMLVGGLFLGLSGASFAIGIPFVNHWFPPARRGLALGIYGAGNVGTAIAGFTSPGIAEATSRSVPFLLVAGVMVATAAMTWLVGRDAPGVERVAAPIAARLKRALELRVTYDLSALYALTFGGFVAFGVYLPTYLKEVYGLETADAGARTAGFILLATAMRPVGGYLADRLGGGRVLVVAFAVVAAGATVQAFAPPIAVATVALLSAAAALGMGNGAVFALVGRLAPPDRVGAVTGFVGASGGLGGFFPPLVMGAVYSATGEYLIGLLLLAGVAAAALAYTLARFGGRRPPWPDETQEGSASSPR